MVVILATGIVAVGIVAGGMIDTVHGAVERIAEDGSAEGREVDAELVGPAGVRTQSQVRDSALGGEDLEVGLGVGLPRHLP